MQDRTPKQKTDWESWVGIAARLGLAIAGLAALVVGLRSAWLSESGSAALLVGAVFIVLALVFTRDLERLFLRFRDTSVEYQRTSPAQVESLERIAISLEAAVGPVLGEPADSAAQLMSLQQEVRQIAAHVEAEAHELSALLAEERERDEQFAETRAWYLREGLVRVSDPPWPDFILVPEHSLNPSPRLAIYLRWWGDWRILCQVTTLSGASYSSVFYGSVYMSGNNFTIAYPDSFPDAQPLKSGTWEFTWTRVGRRTVDGWAAGEFLERNHVEISSEALESQQPGPLTVRRERAGPHSAAEALSDSSP